jgi:hypothetical protein
MLLGCDAMTALPSRPSLRPLRLPQRAVPVADSGHPRLPIPQEQAMGRDVMIVVLGIVLPLLVLLFLAWHYLL